MTAIGPGDWVEFTGPADDPQCIASGVTIGSVWEVFGLVRRVDIPCHACKKNSIVGLNFSRIPGSAACPNHWRPIYRPRADLIERLLEPAEERVGEDA